MASEKAQAAKARRTALRERLWPNERAWTPEGEKGFFQAPRTLALLLTLIRSKRVKNEKEDATRVYVELLCRNMGEGIVEISDEAEHAFACGYVGTRIIRSWRERIRTLERIGFIKVEAVGARQIGLILLVHPGVVVRRLHEAGQLDDAWYNAYIVRKSQTGEVEPEPAAVLATLLRMSKKKAVGA